MWKIIKGRNCKIFNKGVMTQFESKYKSIKKSPRKFALCETLYLQRGGLCKFIHYFISRVVVPSPSCS